MKLPLITTRVKDAPTPATARPTASGSGLPYCVSGVLFQDAASSINTSTISISASAEKTFMVSFTARLWKAGGTIAAGSRMDVELRIDSTAVAFGAPDYLYNIGPFDAGTGGSSLGTSVAVTSLQTLAAGDHDFYVNTDDAGSNSIRVSYSLVVVQFDSTGEGCFEENGGP